MRISDWSSDVCSSDLTLFATGGVIGAILASTCCIAPLLLLTLGISGAWIGTLTAFEPYKPYFAAVAVIFIGLGFRQGSFKAQRACVDGSYCPRPESSTIITKTGRSHCRERRYQEGYNSGVSTPTNQKNNNL